MFSSFHSLPPIFPMKNTQTYSENIYTARILLAFLSVYIIYIWILWILWQYHINKYISKTYLLVFFFVKRVFILRHFFCCFIVLVGMMTRYRVELYTHFLSMSIQYPNKNTQTHNCFLLARRMKRKILNNNIHKNSISAST